MSIMAGIPDISLLQKIEAVVTDFDGVHTDDSVYVDEHGNESVRCSRSDGMGIKALKAAGFKMLILSKERNPVVSRRGEKLNVEVIQGCDDKLEALKTWLTSHKLSSQHCLYIGNDINDLECLQFAGISVSPADAHESVSHAVTWKLSNMGGRGAIREMSDVLIEVKNKEKK
jgi:YrbI family 3-deoxy-D-manno-octulosonate 8-phosphate phosphatase